MVTDKEKLHTLQVPQLVRAKTTQGLDNSRISGSSDETEIGLGYQNTLVSMRRTEMFASKNSL